MTVLGNISGSGKKPATPTIGSATAGSGSATVAFTAPSYTGKGGALTYRATSNPGSIQGTASSSPITVSGLTNGTAYTFQVRLETAYGVNSDYSSSSNSVTPIVPSDYELIQSLSGSSTAFTFSSIPNTYKHLQVNASYQNNLGETLVYRVNGSSTSADYIFQRQTQSNIGGGGSPSYGSGTGTSGGAIIINTGSNGTGYPTFSTFIFPDYAATDTKSKAAQGVGMWKNNTLGNNENNHAILGHRFTALNTTAINSLTFALTSGGTMSNAVINLYGIK